MRPIFNSRKPRQRMIYVKKREVLVIEMALPAKPILTLVKDSRCKKPRNK